jgi:hypothetical protein
MKYLSLFLFQFLLNGMLTGQIWTQIHDLGVSEGGYEINALEDGNYLVSGKEWGFEQLGARYFFTKIDEEGEILWHKDYQLGNGGGSYSKTYTFPLPTGRGLLVVGTTYEMVNENSYGDVFILSLSEQGDSIWSQSIGTNRVESVRGAFLTEDQEHIVFLYSSVDVNNGAYSFFLNKINLDGSLVWSHEVPLTSFAVLHNLVPTPDGNFMAAGYRGIDTNDQYDGLVTKLDQEGNVLWERTYGGDNRDFFFDLEINNDGNPMFWGTTNSVSPKGFLIVETDWEGNEIAQKIIPAPQHPTLSLLHPRMEVLKLNNGRFMLMTDAEDDQFEDFGEGDAQIYWLDSVGNFLHTEAFGNPDQLEFIYNAANCGEGGVILVGSSYESSTGTSLYLAKFSYDTTVSTTAGNEENYRLVAFPNPFQTYLQLNMPASTAYPLMVEIADVHGRTVFSTTIFNDQTALRPNISTPGLYLLKVQGENWTQTIKIIKQ